MAASKLGARTLAVLAVASVGLASACYSTTPHRAQVASSATAHDCTAAITDVFSRSGFVQLPTPPNMSMFFTARLSGPYSSFLRSGAGVGVTINPAGASAGACNVTIEALSPDADCPDAHLPLACGGGAMNLVTGDRVAVSMGNASGSPACPIVGPLMCALSYAPGADNDAAVDELARRVQIALGPSSRVN